MPLISDLFIGKARNIWGGMLKSILLVSHNDDGSLRSDVVDGVRSGLATTSQLTQHTGDTNNPHAVTKAQVGLDLVDNTADAGKPVSTATATALALKANQTSLDTTNTNVAANTAAIATNTTNIPSVAAQARDPLTRWKKNGFSGKKLCLVGDSTTAGAAYLFTRLRDVSNEPGEPLWPLTDANILNYGENGASAAAFLANGVTFGITATIAAQADLYVISYGINDVRLGLTTQSQLRDRIISIVDQIRAGVPNADIVLRVPNSLITTDVGSLGYVSGITAQAATDILRGAYLELRNRWPNVQVWDAMDEVFGTTAQATSAYMGDQLHPNQAGQEALAKALVAVIGNPPVSVVKTSPDRTTIAQTLTTAPWAVDPTVLQDSRYFTLVAEGRYIGQGSGFLDFDWDGTLAGQIQTYDIVAMGTVTPWQIPAGSSFAASGANTRISGMGGSYPPTNTMTAGTVRVYRQRFGNAAIRTKSLLTTTYRYQRFGFVVGGGTNFVDLQADKDSDLLARHWNPLQTDILAIVGRSDLTLTGASFAASGNNLRITGITGDWSGIVGTRFAIFGDHLREAGRYYAVVIDVASIAANTMLETSVTVTGIQTTDRLGVHPPTGLESGLTYSAFISATDTVKLRITNTTGSAIDPVSATWRFTAER